MTRVEILQEAFDWVVSWLEVSEGSDWLVIHHRVAKKLGIDPELLNDDGWKDKDNEC